MKKKLSLCVLALLAVCAIGSAQAGRPGEEDLFGLDSYLFGDVEPERELGTISLGELRAFAGKLSILQQRAAWVRRSWHASAVFPGAGQYMNENPTSGTLFLIAHLGIIAGTIFGAYALLPDDLKFDRIDYLSDSYASIEDAWKRQSLGDFVPSFAVALGGMIADGILRGVSASHARDLAVRRIRAGEITFEPDIQLLAPWWLDPDASPFGNPHGFEDWE